MWKEWRRLSGKVSRCPESGGEKESQIMGGMDERRLG